MRESRKYLTTISVIAIVAVTLNATAAHAVPEALCVVPHKKEPLPRIHHSTYSGAEITLKGIARGDAVEYKWDFGDGGDTGWQPIGNRYNLGVKHTYVGGAGETFTATLHVKNAGAEEDSGGKPSEDEGGSEASSGQ